LAGPGGPATIRRQVEASLSGALERLAGRAAVSMIIRRQIGQVLQAFAERSIPAVVIKGPEFADRLYRDPSLRSFTDGDLLVGRESFEQAKQIMEQLGYSAKPTAMKYQAGYGEQSFIRPGGGSMAVEIHWNLVNSPTMRRGVSVELSDLQFEAAKGAAGGHEGLPGRRLSAGALLLIAAVHAAAGHVFDRLQPLCDVCQAAREAAGEIDAAWLAETAKRTGAGLAVRAALELAGELLNEPRCSRLLAELHTPAGPAAWRLLINSSMVLRGGGGIDSVRRNIFRAMLKRRR